MFERYITNALTTHFGHILENVDSDKIQLSAWNGELTMEDVAIKTTALDTILRGPENSPVEIAYGHIGAFKVKIPWSLMSSLLSGNANMDDGNPSEEAKSAAASISVVLTDVDILITPRRKFVTQCSGSDDETEEKDENSAGNSNNVNASNTFQNTEDARRAEKERKVQELLDANLLKRVTESSILAAEDKKGSWTAWLQEKLAQLLSNLSITIENIHVRYEDPGTSMGFEWRIFRQDENNNAYSQNSNLNLNLRTADPKALSRRTSIESIIGRRNQNREYGNPRLRRFRPAFAVGISLKKFSVQSATLPKKKQQSPEDDETFSGDMDTTFDDTTNSFLSATTATSTNADISTTAVNDFIIRRQHKRAAANDLAIYWDSTAKLICGRIKNKIPSQQHSQLETKESTDINRNDPDMTKKESFDYFQSCFSILNEESPSSVTSTKTRAKHSYLLDPISPSVDLTIVSKIAAKPSTKDGVKVTGNSDDDLSEAPMSFHQENSSYTIPPSSIKIELPPCKFTLSRNTLEDTVYLRKSLSVWSDTRKTLISESALRRIIKLRPSESARKDPVGWWKYAFEATKILTQASLSSKLNDDIELDNDDPIENQEGKVAPGEIQDTQMWQRVPRFSRRKGWVGFVEAVSRRRKYVNLYNIILKPPISLANNKNHESEIQKLQQQEAHESLLRMEDTLLTREIVAFRIHVYQDMNNHCILKSNDGDEIHDHQNEGSRAAMVSSMDSNSDNNPEQSTGRWSSWIGRGTSDSNNNSIPTKVDNEVVTAESGQMHVMVKGETDEEMLTIEHRRWMMNEMKQALDREKANMQNHLREGSRRSSVLQMTQNVLLAGNMPVDKSNPVVWTVSLICRKFAIQVNDQNMDHDTFRNSSSTLPVIRMSSAWVQDQSWFRDGSWEVDISLASMEVIDLISGRGKHSSERYVSTLLGSNSRPGKCDNEYLLINGIRYNRNMSVKIKRRLHWNMPIEWIQNYSNIDRGSTTTVKIEVLPMEIIYSTLPIETAKRVFSTVKTPEIVDDYHKVLGVAKSWRNKQKEKLLETLAHKNKQIIVDIDITAPELLIPENIYRPDSPMLAINFGRLQAYNDNERPENNNVEDFDDQWRVLVSNIQVQSTSMSSYHSRSSPNLLHEQLVEAFSIDSIVSTKFTKVESDSKESRINVSTTLPRLAFNITSSAIRLISRLRSNFAKRERQIHGESILYHTYSSPNGHPKLLRTKEQQAEAENTSSSLTIEKNDGTSRLLKFDFSAPAITLKLENDVDGRKCTDEMNVRSTPILDLALRSIRGSFSQELTNSGTSITKFDAKLRSLGVIDLYQSAGDDFVLLMSSIPHNQLCQQIDVNNGYSWDDLHTKDDTHDVNGASKDLVTVEYYSRIKPSTGPDSHEKDKEASDDDPDQISLWFHELYVEWNPETLAAIHAAMRTTSVDENDCSSSEGSSFIQTNPFGEDESSEEDEFFDALEDEPCDPEDIDSYKPLSEISTSTDDLAAIANPWNSLSRLPSNVDTLTLSPIRLLSQGRISLSPESRSSLGIGQFHSARMYDSGQFDALKLPTLERESNRTNIEVKSRRREIVFKLSKLRVSFNKETRHRKLFVAQMNRTFVSYSTEITGRSRLNMNIGNLVFIDPAHEESKTLYGQILGLQTKSKGVDENSYSSLLEMEVIMNPKVREFSSLIDVDRSDTVIIDRERGKMGGSNNCVTAKFSPMRFVLIEQLWMEIMDYFFQGIIGTEVLGGQTKKSSSDSSLLALVGSMPVDSNFVLGSDAAGFNFTRFDISLESPVIIFPVTYSSPNYLRMTLKKISLSNEYDGAVLTDEGLSKDGVPIQRMQWFNNCEVLLEDLQLYSWTGRQLDRHPTVGCISLRWPTGPFAPLIIPKWRVNCSFEALDISLCRSDYSLLQNIISYNIGEPSRHMDEWRVLQTMSQDVHDKFMQKFIVHYGYDQKNVAPSTYSVKLMITTFKARFLETDNQDSTPIAIARCFDLRWHMRKESDLIMKQTVTCGIDLVRPLREITGFETLMTISKDNSDFDGEGENKDRARPNFTYSSTSFPDGDNVKTIHIFDPCIYLIIPAWSRFTSFFQSLSPPIFLNEREIGASIQVGDRWYRIGDDDSRRSNLHTPLGMGNVGKEQFNWISTELTNVNPSGLLRKAPLAKDLPTLQIKVLMTWPRIILSSVNTDDHPTRVILRMNHAEFLQTNEGQKFEKTKSLFLHDVEVYTSSQKLSTHSTSKDQEQNSLIRPWNLSAITTARNGESDCSFAKFTYKISGDVLRARAAYSDISIAVDVLLSVLHTTREKSNVADENQLPQHPILSSSNSFDSKDSKTARSCDENSAENEESSCTTASVNVYDIHCDGFELKIADDSGRHFSGHQDLAIFSVGKTLFSRHESSKGIVSMKLWLDCLDLFDCLQPIDSPFRNAASSHSNVMGSNTSKIDENNTRKFRNSSIHRNIQRQMSWDEFATTFDGKRNFETSKSFRERIEETSTECSYYLWGEGGEGPTPGLIEISCKFTENSYQEYDIRFRKFALQWNPSTIIAIQRFLGRLRKESKLIAGQVFGNQFEGMIDGSRKIEISQKDTSLDSPKVDSLIRANIQVDSLTVCMNKEHQHRRLLELTLSSCNVVLHSTEEGISVEGQIGDLSAFENNNDVVNKHGRDSTTKTNRTILSVLAGNDVENTEKFLRIYYKTFTKKATSTSKANVPDWIKQNLPSPDDIDDFLSLSVATTRFIYLKERTEEILDYLSNGLPGKGMGATSRAAKGFISRRIQTRSFLQVRINSPQIYIPQHELAQQGLGLKLGDVNVQSWFEEAFSTTKESIDSEWWRVLSLKLVGFSCGMIRMGSNFDSLTSATNPIDLDILLRKPTIKGRTLSVKGFMSSFEVVLTYEDYVLLRAVVRDNIGRHINTDEWDNIEKAYWQEEEDSDHRPGISGPTDATNRVAYSTNARFVRYGKSGKKGIKKAHPRTSEKTNVDDYQNVSTHTLDVRFGLKGVALKLRRNDLPEGIAEDDDIATAFHYDVMLLRVGNVEVLTTANASGDISFNLSLFHVGLFDLGDNGRLIRERYYYSLPSENMLPRKRKKTLSQPCPFVVLAEGYLSEGCNDTVDHIESDLDGPEFVISIDVCPASSTNGFLPLSETSLPPDTKVTVAKVVVNYLSLNAIIRPFRDIADFFSCSWPIRSKISPQYQKVGRIEQHATEKKKSTDDDKKEEYLRGFQLKMVAHYPRVFFLADESDLNSRALVLKGLAVANVSTVSKREMSGPKNSSSLDIQQITSVGAQLHSLETYINPDVSDALRLRKRHLEMIGSRFSTSLNVLPDDKNEAVGDTLGVALIQPVTIGIEYIQIERDLFPTRRSLQINIDPVSTMLSFGDLQLVETILKRWSTNEDRGSEDRTDHQDSLVRSESTKESTKETMMESRMESMKESKVPFQIIFNSKRLGLGLRAEGTHVVVNTVQNTAYNHKIQQGDVLTSISNESVLDMPLEQIVKILAESGRPVTVGFERSVASPVAQGESESPKIHEGDHADDSADGYPISIYTLHFRSDIHLGLAFEKSVCAQFPVVSKILSSIDDAVVLLGSMDDIDSEQIEVIDSVFNSEHTRLPKVGAVVVAVDGVPVEELGAEEVWQILEKVQASDVSRRLIGSENASNVTFSLTFQETHSSTWGKIDTIEISSAGMALSFIDDLNGRDMPLFRGKLSSLEVHMERGLGINAHILDNTIPSLLTPVYPDSDEANSDLVLSIDEVEDIQTESIISFSVISICSVDYFRPRVSFWEPLLEPSQLFFHVEKQDGNIELNRPAQIALEVSDRLLHDQFTRATSIQNNRLGKAHMVSINVTDAAAEVLAETKTRFEDWRKNLKEESDDVDIEFVKDMILKEGQKSYSAVADFHMAHQDGHFQDEVLEGSQRSASAARKAALGALIFAQKRGAETSKKSDSAKPFIFRNRTGISIAFVQQGCGLRSRGSSARRLREPGEASSFTATIGEYDGLEEYGQESITELADQEDAKFNMDLIDENFENSSQRRSTNQFANKIRSYEGRYPDLTVAIQAVAGILVEPITNLQVFKVGSTIRHLTVKKDNGSYTGLDSTRNSIQVVWNVEIEDNRRILTLSTAVRLVSAGLTMPIEIGFRQDKYDNIKNHPSENVISSIGIARSEYPYYMPLWLALKLEPVSIYVRPASTGNAEHSWSELSVLQFNLFAEGRVIADGHQLNNSTTGRWTWEETFVGLRFVCCRSKIEEKYPTWFSVYGSSSSTLLENFSTQGEKPKKNTTRQRNGFDAYEVLSIVLDCGLTVRNMLPAVIEMEVVQGDESGPRSGPKDKGASHFSFDEVEPDLSKFDTLNAGECTEVFEVNYSATVPKIRIKHPYLKGWSTWAHLELGEEPDIVGDDDNSHPNKAMAIKSITPSQVNIQVPGGDFGLPMTFGVRIEPKSMTDGTHRIHVYGLEVILYAELWIRNITSLALNFGCPANQIYEPKQTFKSPSNDLITKFTAESALMELTSLLEVGDKGTVLNQKVTEDDSENLYAIESLPGQQCRVLTEEVFEYVEVENSTIKRKWWASENYNGYHRQILDVDDTGANWKWLDEKWMIDSSGGAKQSVDGWESCKNLCTRNRSFGGKREFNSLDSFRRRRFFRRRSGYLYGNNRPSVGGLNSQNSTIFSGGELGAIQAFHQPLMDAFSREQKNSKESRRRENANDSSQPKSQNDKLKIAIRFEDGSWSSPAEISYTGTCYGVIRALASRWPTLTQRHIDASQSKFSKKENPSSVQKASGKYEFNHGCLAPDLYEFCYTVSDLEGEWGEFSRSMEVSPRFLVRNDSKVVYMKVKQSGAPNSTSVVLEPGKARPFYWSDFRLPKLVSVVPFDASGIDDEKFRWSGGFDPCNLGMTPVRIRNGKMNIHLPADDCATTSIRVLVEVRPGTGGHGINVSLREEAPDGDGSLFRIENLSPFPIWLSQDGVLANPIASTRNTSNRTSFVDGDCIQPSSRSTFALDVPYRQGKYAHRKEASLSELMHVRAALAPLSSRIGIESVKVIGLATMGETIRLNPMKLPSKLTSQGQDILRTIRILGVVATDGPTRVLRFCLIAYPMGDPVSSIPTLDTLSIATSQSFQDKSSATSHKDYTEQIAMGIHSALEDAIMGKIPTEIDAKREALFVDLNADVDDNLNHINDGSLDKVFSLRLEFSGFIFSLVDSAPSEIALASLRNVNALARWNNLRSTEATVLLSIGWLQIDNHIPSAPFKVAVRPDIPKQQDDERGPESSPLLVVAVALAPEHKSKIVVLRSVTVAPRDLVIALDLAFIVRLQRFFIGLQDHLRRSQHDGYLGLNQSSTEGSFTDQKKIIPFPNFFSPEKQLEQIASFSENKKMYFQGLTILPTNIKLSVAPAKALTFEQASLEGKETAAIHTAVRKGDVLVGGKSVGPLGVRVGRKNRTPLAVVRGVFKSIVVDALLRLSGASLNFHGVFLRNYIATSTQLSTYLAAHYLSSLKYNVPALLGSLSAIGNPLGLIRGIGDGVSDFVTEPMKGFKRALKELDPGYAVDGVARGTESLARHTVGGIADSASLLMETFSKYMAVVTLDRRYAQKRDRSKSLRLKSDTKVTLVGGVESGFLKLVQGFREGVTGVVRAPIRGAEKHGLEGFAKGLGKGLLGLLVKPIIGITDAATDVMIGVKSTVEYKEAQRQNLALVRNQFRPRRPMYGHDKVLRPFSMEDAAAATLMLKTKCAGENYLSHLEMDDRVALLSVKRLIILGPKGEEQLALKFKHVKRLEVRSIREEDGITEGWAIIVVLNTPRRNGSDVEVISCRSEQEAIDLCMLVQQGVDLASMDSIQEN